MGWGWGWDGGGGGGGGWHYSVITEMRGCEKGQIAMTQIVLLV